MPRTATGYRIFSTLHLEQMRLARIAFRCEFVEGNIRERAALIVTASARGDLEGALQKAYEYLEHIKNEQKKAEEALDIAQKWVSGDSINEDTGVYYKRNDVARLLEISIDVLRNWERNGLIQIPRRANQYRIYGANEINRLKIIRSLRSSNYSMVAIHRMMSFIDAGGTDMMRDVIDTPLPEDDIISATDRWISSLAETEADAHQVILQLKKMIKLFR